MVNICNKSINFAVILTKPRISCFRCLTKFIAKLALLLDITKDLPTKIFLIMDKRKISLAELYKEKMAQLSPGRQLIQDLMDATGRSEVTVRLWIGGKFKPEPIIQNIIAETLGIDVDYLFVDGKDY